MYVDFTFYADEFKGNKVVEADFERLEARAETYLNSVTGGRATISPAIADVKRCLCAIAEQFLAQEQGGELQSQSVGSWSKTFKTSEKSFENKLYSTTKMYLINTNLLCGWC